MKKSEIIVHIHRPVLTEEERARRMECIRHAAAEVLLDAMRVEREQARKKHLEQQTGTQPEPLADQRLEA